MPIQLDKSFYRNGKLRRKTVSVLVGLVAFNVVAWIWAFWAFHAMPILLGTAALAYSFGMRHAFDADHIAAIDNATRKMMEQRKRPVTAGLWFSLGHSLVLLLATLGIVFTLTSINGKFDSLNDSAAVVGTVVSASFLFIMAIFNIAIAKAAYGTFKTVRNGGKYEENDLNLLMSKRGLFARIFRPIFRFVTESWHLFPIGFLFGFGFDTVTEVSLLGIAAAGASHGMSVMTVLVFPVLFAAGMSLMDTIDGILMVGAYGWAYKRPIRKLYYNITVTSVSVIVAVFIGGIETAGLISHEFGLTGGFWALFNNLGDHSGEMGIGVIGIFVISWILSVSIYKWKGYEREPDMREYKIEPLYQGRG